MKRVKSYWIKKRSNPQLGTYYVAKGQLSKTAAKEECGSIYGSNEMLEFKTESEYTAAIETLKAEGHDVHMMN